MNQKVLISKNIGISVESNALNHAISSVLFSPDIDFTSLTFSPAQESVESSYDSEIYNDTISDLEQYIHVIEHTPITVIKEEEAPKRFSHTRPSPDALKRTKIQPKSDKYLEMLPFSPFDKFSFENDSSIHDSRKCVEIVYNKFLKDIESMKSTISKADLYKAAFKDRSVLPFGEISMVDEISGISMKNLNKITEYFYLLIQEKPQSIRHLAHNVMFLYLNIVRRHFAANLIKSAHKEHKIKHPSDKTPPAGATFADLDLARREVEKRRRKAGRSSKIMNMTKEQLIADKADVKAVLRSFDDTFKLNFGRLPLRKEKEGLRPLYSIYKQLKQRIVELEKRGKESGRKGREDELSKLKRKKKKVQIELISLKNNYDKRGKTTNTLTIGDIVAQYHAKYADYCAIKSRIETLSSGSVKK
ncbi:hypothetical protein ADUPG1_011267 [Aduncisulcus paluster]|uniref:FAM13A-like domain-containing protein n=1 Tax=Aduncisulcus paluster TaxID=2918883 RepID=A0ABQ5JVX0_9EUKA|nr:hypothetical protein ADUPG1_011267 [Aduncisulcus paluster]